MTLLFFPLYFLVLFCMGTWLGWQHGHKLRREKRFLEYTGCLCKLISHMRKGRDSGHTFLMERYPHFIQCFLFISSYFIFNGACNKSPLLCKLPHTCNHSRKERESKSKGGKKDITSFLFMFKSCLFSILHTKSSDHVHRPHPSARDQA
jgi:hypothetical protein